MRRVESRQPQAASRVAVVEQLAIHIFTIMTRRRRSSALPPGNLCYSARQSQAYPSQYCKSIIYAHLPGRAHICYIPWARPPHQPLHDPLAPRRSARPTPYALLSTTAGSTTAVFPEPHHLTRGRHPAAIQCVQSRPRQCRAPTGGAGVREAAGAQE